MTLLSQQLQKLSLPRDKVRSGTIQHSSLIFSQRVASDYDIQDLYDIGLNGIEELGALNPVFNKFKDTLFHSSSVGFERLVKTKDVLQDIDREIELFLAHVSSYSLLSPAHKALEWLIRAFKIHHYNAEVLLYTFLPLHDSKIFAKLLEIVDLPENWKWLEVAKSNNVGVTKEDLTQLCTRNPQYFLYLVNSAIRVLELTESAARIHNSFLVTLVFLVLERLGDVPTAIIPKLYSAIVKTIHNTHKDVKAVGYIIAGQLVRKVALKSDVITELLTVLSESTDDALTKELVLSFCCVSHYQNIVSLPHTTVQLMLQDSYISTLATIASTSNVNSFLKCLLNSTIELSYAEDLMILDTIKSISTKIELSDDLKQYCCDQFFERYFLADGNVNEAVKKLGEYLSSTLTKEFQDLFEGHHKNNSNAKILESLKNMILGELVNTDSYVSLIESHHNLSGIRMLSLLKISQKLENSTSISETEKDELFSHLLSRLQDEDNAVCLKALDILGRFSGVIVDAVYDTVLSGILQKSKIIASKKRVDPKFVYNFIIKYLRFPIKNKFLNTLLSLLINLLPRIDTQEVKSLSEEIKAVKGQKRLAKVIADQNIDKLYAYIWGFPDLSELLRMFAEQPTAEHFKFLSISAINDELSVNVKDLISHHLIDILMASVERKSDVKPYVFDNLKEAIGDKASHIFSNFTLLKREWEMVVLVQQILTELLPHTKNTDILSKLLDYFWAYFRVYGKPSILVKKINKKILYSFLVKRLITCSVDDENVNAGIEYLRATKIEKSEDLKILLPYLMVALSSRNTLVRQWSYKRLKAISKMENMKCLSHRMISELHFNRGMTISSLGQEINRVCRNLLSDEMFEPWFEELVQSGLEVPEIFQILGPVQLPVKINTCLNLLMESKTASTSIFGDLTPDTAAYFNKDKKIFTKFLSLIRNSAINCTGLVESINDEFVTALSDTASRDLVMRLVERSEAECPEHLQLNIRQKLSEVDRQRTVDTLVGALEDNVSSGLLATLQMTGYYTKEIVKKLFGMLERGQCRGVEEDLVAILTSAVTSIGKDTPLTPATLRSIVQLITDTKTEANRHALHHSTLLLLSKLAACFPARVLDHIMPIFTFMGDTTLRMDDQYSLQVVMMTVETIVPVISRKKDVLGVVRVFCDALPHIPSHRQDPIFKLLLGTTGHQYLYHVFLYVLEGCSKERDRASESSHFLQMLCSHLSLPHVIKTAVTMVTTLSKLPDDLSKPIGKVYKVTADTDVELQFSDMKHYNYFKLGLATQLCLLTASKHFSEGISQLDDEGPNLAELVEISLSIMIHHQLVTENNKFTEILSKRLTSLVTNITSSLPLTLFVSVLKALLATKTTVIHQKSLQILEHKLKGKTSLWTPEFREGLASLTTLLLDLTSSLPQSWCVLERLCKDLGSDYYESFTGVLVNAVSCQDGICEEQRSFIATCIESLAVRCVPYVSDIVTMATSNVLNNKAIIAALINTIPHFLSAQIPEILIKTSSCYSSSLTVITEAVGTRVNLRVLVPALEQVLSTVNSLPHADARVLPHTMAHAIQANSAKIVNTHLTEITGIFKQLLSYRDNIDSDRFDIDKEKETIESFVYLVYKLTEKEFLPLVVTLMEWSHSSVSRNVTFYHLMSELSLRLQGLFLLFAGSIFNDMVEKLQSSTKSSDGFTVKKAKVESRDEVKRYVLLTLTNILKFDQTHSFTSPDRFERLLPVLLELVGDEDTSYLVQPLALLPVAANSDRLWKQYNYQLLSLSKTRDHKVRKNVVTVYREFVTKLGQDYSGLLADSVPFLSELLEDTDASVEDIAHDIVKTIEKVTGESMDQYF